MAAKFDLKQTKHLDGTPIGPGTVRLEFTAEFNVSNLGQEIRDYFQVEIIQGSIDQLPNGSVVYSFECGADKAEVLLQIIHLLAFKPNPN